MSSGTGMAMDVLATDAPAVSGCIDRFVESYARRLGHAPAVELLACDMDVLRDALEAAIATRDPELYAAADELVQIFERQPPSGRPLPAAAQAELAQTELAQTELAKNPRRRRLI